MNLSLKNIKKQYGDRQVLDLEELEIEAGKITGIRGPNGCGNTTLLNIIGGLDMDYCGQVLYGGGGLNKEIMKRMTTVFQKPYLLKRTVYDNIEYPLKLRGINREKSAAKVYQIMRDLEIEDLKDKRADKLSGGESQKVALARALVFQPDLLLLDEPTSNIDPDYIITMERVIKQYNLESKSTIILVTHNIEQSERICHNIISMRRGRVVEDGIF